MKLYVFTDRSFVNNTDLTFQLGFIIILVIETGRIREDFDIYRNIIYWSLIKYKRVTKSMLASKLYRIMTGFNSSITLSMTLN